MGWHLPLAAAAFSSMLAGVLRAKRAAFCFDDAMPFRRLPGRDQVHCAITDQVTTPHLLESLAQ